MNDLDIYDMKLHETITSNEYEFLNQPCEFIITRVLGGWIYSIGYRGLMVRSISFVPFNNEFQEKK